MSFEFEITESKKLKENLPGKTRKNQFETETEKKQLNKTK